MLITITFANELLTRLQAKNLKICITAGVGSDHIDLNACVSKGIQVLEVGYNSP